MYVNFPGKEGMCKCGWVYAERGQPRCGMNYVGVRILAVDLVGELYVS